MVKKDKGKYNLQKPMNDVSTITQTHIGIQICFTV
jgi:hypothetical protein